MDREIIYTAFFVDDKEALEKRYPTDKPNKYYDHCTIKYRPTSDAVFEEEIGEENELHIIGRLTTKKVDALVIEHPRGDYFANRNLKVLHITLGTADGVPPVTSGDELKRFFAGGIPAGCYLELDEYVETKYGVYTPDGEITNKKQL